MTIFGFFQERNCELNLTRSNGLLKGYFSYNYYYADEVVKNFEKTTRIFCSYYLEYNQNNQVIKQFVSSWNGYTGVK